MKIVITFVLLLFMTAIQAMPADKDSVEKGKKAQVSTPATAPGTSTLLTMQQLQEENANLKAQILEMENRLENENSMLQYKLVMLNIISKLNESSKQEKMEDLQSHIGFSNIMSNIMLLIRSKRASHVDSELTINVRNKCSSRRSKERIGSFEVESFGVQTSNTVDSTDWDRVVGHQRKLRNFVGAATKSIRCQWHRR